MSNTIQKDKPWERGYAAIRDASLTHGDTIDRHWLLKEMGILPPEKCASGQEAKVNQLLILRAMEQVKEELLECHNMALRPIPGTGWEIVRPEDQTAWAMSEARKELRRALRAAVKRVSYVEASALTSDQRKENADALAKLSAFRPAVRKQLW